MGGVCKPQSIHRATRRFVRVCGAHQRGGDRRVVAVCCGCTRTQHNHPAGVLCSALHWCHAHVDLAPCVHMQGPGWHPSSPCCCVQNRHVCPSRVRFPLHANPARTTAAYTKITRVQNFGKAAGNVLGVPLPPPSSPSQVAAFAIVSVDHSNTTLHCKLNVPTGAVVALAGPYADNFSVNTDFNCTSPQVFSVRSAGQYSLEVWARDAVGNVEHPPKSHAFGVTYAAGSMFTHVSGVPWGRTNSFKQSMQLSAVQGTADGTGQPAAVSTFEQAVDTFVNGAWKVSTWAPVTTGANFTFQVWPLYGLSCWHACACPRTGHRNVLSSEVPFQLPEAVEPPPLFSRIASVHALDAAMRAKSFSN